MQKPGNKRGENYELRIELNSEYKDRRKEGVKKVISNMTIGKDVSALFADVVKNMQTEDLELKKLVYLYLINYAKSNPELVILAVNTFVKDTDDHNPLIRALAIRTMGCLRVEKIVNYLMEPLKKALKDSDPYVRKTAAICVAKLFDLNPSTAIDNGLVASLQDMLGDGNPMVIANAVAALSEISNSSVKDVFLVTNLVLTKLLAALNECTEWGQICILSSLAKYKPVDVKEANEIIDRVVPRLQHANASVVLSAVKVLMIYMPFIQDAELKVVVKKIAPSLVTLLSEAPEIQYVALRNINLILQKRPEILSHEMRVFFTKYNDPLYVKLEKLQVMIKLASEKNIDVLLSELREYANEVDIQFVRKSIQSIGKCAIKIESCSEKCVNVLLELIKSKSNVSYIVQESIIVMKDIFRRYPNKYERVIPNLCENLENLDEPDARASLIWIIGEYVDRIQNSQDLLQFFAEGFKDETVGVQLQLLTASVKLFLKRPGNGQALVNDLLTAATQGCENPDVRDRAYVYWRLLSSSPEVAKAVVLAEKPPIDLDSSAVSETLLEELIMNIASLASVYHISPALLGQSANVGNGEKRDEEMDDQDRTIANTVRIAQQGGIGNLLDLDFDAPTTATFSPMKGAAPSYAPSIGTQGGLDDLLGMMDDLPTSSPQNFGANNSSPMSWSSSPTSSSSFVFPKTLVLDAVSSQGLNLLASFSRRNGRIFIDFTFSNKSTLVLSDFAIQFNNNSFGLVPATQLSVPSLTPNQSYDTSLEMSFDGVGQGTDPFNSIQIAIKNNLSIFYFAIGVPIHVLFSEDAISESLNASSLWNSMNLSSLEFRFSGNSIGLVDKFKRNNVFLGVEKSPVSWLFFAKFKSTIFLFDVLFNMGSLVVNVKCSEPGFLGFIEASLSGIANN